MAAPAVAMLVSASNIQHHARPMSTSHRLWHYVDPSSPFLTTLCIVMRVLIEYLT
ncbi:hypothetical protein AURDEDRAFT_178142 [Auricularia subglabra TFB-10046 SS5]|uniref:Uncharacterized protein n=1 Tax=Auricularia subglabra (strain TFB-10046 / SS5) TaxID=717982 RepID=J0L8R7_AURST|nr:hypothetical protein AURDEDRAFT_178142 [Auricularia subglabra TFB-10046 SS5]